MSKLILTIVILFGILCLACGFGLLQNFVVWLIGERPTFILVLLIVGVFVYKIILPELKAESKEQ
ncbi:hypothetical protein [Acinetobacter pittii]|uniref:hypothetical protein n=1 Tax=Acinetobacter pittii TaxID=48296 RepID=UPI00355B0B2F